MPLYCRSTTPACLLVVLMSMPIGCSSSKPKASVPYHQSFEQPLGEEWSSRSSSWQVVDGRLFNDGSHNVPLWLDAPLPRDVRISFDATSESEAVDIKFEVFGDGEHHESGYIVILAGWNNSRSVIARLSEHGERFNPPRTRDITKRLRQEVEAGPEAAAQKYRSRREIVTKAAKMQPRRQYRLLFEREGHELRFFVDGKLHLQLYDPAPLGGSGQDRFAFNNWASRVYFDDLRIESL